MSVDQGRVPEACTLSDAERPLRLAEFDALFATAVRQVERIDATRLRLTLTGPDTLKAAVADLTERESRCCSFFDFDVTADGQGQVVVTIAVPAAHVGVLDALAARATPEGTR